MSSYSLTLQEVSQDKYHNIALGERSDGTFDVYYPAHGENHAPAGILQPFQLGNDDELVIVFPADSWEIWLNFPHITWEANFNPDIDADREVFIGWTQENGRGAYGPRRTLCIKYETSADDPVSCGVELDAMTESEPGPAPEQVLSGSGQTSSLKIKVKVTRTSQPNELKHSP